MAEGDRRPRRSGDNQPNRRGPNNRNPRGPNPRGTNQGAKPNRPAGQKPQRSINAMGNLARFIPFLNRPKNVPDDAWAAISGILNESLRENIRARRWRNFFRLFYLVLISAILINVLGNVNPNNRFLNTADAGNSAEDHVALISIKGPVLPDAVAYRGESVKYQPVKEALHKAFENNNAKAIILDIESGGGSPLTSSSIYNEITKLRAANPDKKVYAIVANLGASAAYHIASAADEIYSHPMSLVGSIGVITRYFGYDQLLEEYGIDYRIYTAGRNKDALSPFAPRNAEHEAQLQYILDKVHEYFIEDVIAGRGDRIDQNNPDIFSGFVFLSDQALELGLIDDVGYFDELVKEKIGLDNLVDYSVRPINPLSSLPFNVGADFASGIWERLTSANKQDTYKFQ